MNPDSKGLPALLRNFRDEKYAMENLVERPFDGTGRFWVVGLLYVAFPGEGKIVMVRKNRPASQLGKLNGPGGKVEVGETARMAMAREFYEETGSITDPLGWAPIVVSHGPNNEDESNTDPWVVVFFRGFTSHDRVQLDREKDEPPEMISLREIPERKDLADLLQWMIPMGAAPEVANIFLTLR